MNYSNFKKISLIVFVFTVVIFAKSAHASTATSNGGFGNCTSNGGGVSCNGTITGPCQSFGCEQVYAFDFGGELDGHGSAGSSGGRLGLSACISSNTVMWSSGSACYILIESNAPDMGPYYDINDCPDHGNPVTYSPSIPADGNLGDNCLWYNLHVDNSGDYNSAFRYLNYAAYVNDASFNGDNFTLYGRHVSADNLGAFTGSNPIGSANAGDNFDLRWSTDSANPNGVSLFVTGGATNPDNWSAQVPNNNLSGSSYNYTCTSTGSEKYELVVWGPSGSGQLQTNRIIFISCGGATPPPPPPSGGPPPPPPPSPGGPPPPPPPAPGGCIDDAQVSFSAIPATLAPGQTVSFNVHAIDGGISNSRWYNGSGYLLQQTSPNPKPTIISTAPPSVAGVAYGHLPNGTYSYNDTIDWSFDLTAPATPGTYVFSMQMKHIQGWDYIQFDGTTTCIPPASDIFFGEKPTVTFIVVQPAATCTSLDSTSDVYSVSAGTVRRHVYGVTNATSVFFPTWSNTAGQDDLIWYPGTDAGGGTWYVDIPLANHPPANSTGDIVSVHVYMNNPSNANVFCGAANFTTVPANFPPSIALDNPIAGSTVSGITAFSGWAIDNITQAEGPVVRVDLYIDGVLINNSSYGTVNRGGPGDVCSLWPGRPGCPNVGFGIGWDSTSVPNGTHTATAVATDSTGLTGQASAVFTVNNIIPAPSNLTLSCPAPGTTVTASWTAPAGWNTFYLRANPGANNGTWPAAVIQDNIVGTSSTFSSIAGQTYYVWIHTRNPVDGSYSTAIAKNVTCGAPPAATGWIKCNGTLAACSIAYNGSGTITWQTTDTVVGSCHVTAANGTNWPGENNLAGNPTGNLTTNQIYTLGCTGTDGLPYSWSVVVNVASPTGTIQVFSNASAGFTLIGAGGTCCAAGSGTYALYSSVPPDTYTVSSSLSGYSGPVITDQTGTVLAGGVQVLPASGSIEFHMAFLQQPTGVSGSNATCGRIVVTWNPSIGATGYRILRSSTGAGGPYTQISANATSPYTDFTVTPNTSYNYEVQAFNSSNGLVATSNASASSLALQCIADLSNSSKIIYQVNAAAYTGQQINTGDIITFHVIISNANTASSEAGTINGLTDTYTSNLTVVAGSYKLDKGSGYVSVAGFSSVTGVINPGQNWVFEFKATADLAANNTGLIKNTAQINCVSASGGNCTVTRTASHVLSPTNGKNPQFREVAP